MALLQVARSKYDIFHFLALHGFRHYMCVLSTPFDDIPVLLPKTLELLFMMTELFLTVPALRVSVRPVRKPLGIILQWYLFIILYLPVFVLPFSPETRKKAGDRIL